MEINCCENCVNCVRNIRGQWSKCYLHIKYRDGVEKIFTQVFYNNLERVNVCKFYKRKEEEK